MYIILAGSAAAAAAAAKVRFSLCVGGRKLPHIHKNAYRRREKCRN